MGSDWSNAGSVNLIGEIMSRDTLLIFFKNVASRNLRHVILDATVQPYKTWALLYLGGNGSEAHKS